MKLHKIVAVATLILLTFPTLSLQADAQKLKLTLVDGSVMEGDFTANATRFTSNNVRRTYTSGYQMKGKLDTDTDTDTGGGTFYVSARYTSHFDTSSIRLIPRQYTMNIKNVIVPRTSVLFISN